MRRLALVTAAFAIAVLLVAMPLVAVSLVASGASAQISAQEPARPLTPPEAVAHLLFSGVTMAMPRTVTQGRVTYRGATIPGDPERTILSISASRAAPCLFEAFFIEAPAPAGDPKIAVTTAYHATIDLRRLDRATLGPAPRPASGAQLLLAAKDMYCSRSMILEQTPKLTYSESCLDTVDDAITPEQMPRLHAAFEVLRLACRW